ncbi:phospholipid carrier-dependent glycosyltransferase [Naumannella sp. ID2617S]|uniref:Polyprenol-phosphate-mannose--protein mannosyltransferase n=1 Tax=Enemella dayhoffiae TaxID=2016507 RepID=A0A255GX46_9ACTN|nr:phospholipid carrier-dependent glycosyltransferase [Enemella dayhoffiae]NNG18263.1 phospholipid carrier-dependent glycosyltransferase [Naumannella sp. ID2617S]OYO18154.1 dolichyl-phosphate-mannose--protein mannosyltransferase [Enemella dayhoffiae]
MPNDLALAWVVGMSITLIAFVLRMVDLGRPAGMVFDEIYYAKDGYALITTGFEHDWAEGADQQVLRGDFSGMKESGSFIVHPPLGKYLIALGIKAFGFNAFGFRIAAVFFGCALLTVVFFLTRRLARSTLIGGIAALLLSLDGLHFVMSRIALLDIFQAFFCVLGVAVLVRDRDWFREKLADHLAAKQLPDLGGRFGPIFWWRPWRLVAGIVFGAACATKWNSIYVLAAFSLLSVIWDVGARRLAGAGVGSLRGLVVDGPIAFVYQVVLAGFVYLSTWAGWLSTSGGYDRNWGAEHPDDPVVRILGQGLGSLLQYHRDILDFHTGQGIKDATHPYSASPAGWLFVARPIGIDAVNDIQPGTQGCPGPETCLRVISGMGTPILWWAGVFALLASLVLWLFARDWRFGVPVLGVASTWLTWFPNSDRPLFFFYAIVIIPFTCIAVALVLGRIIGPADGGERRRFGGIIAGAFVALVALNFAFIHPILTDAVLPMSHWQWRMWFQSWI